VLRSISGYFADEAQKHWLLAQTILGRGFIFRDRAVGCTASVPVRAKTMIGFGLVSRRLNLDRMIEPGNGLQKLSAK
jgi:hypothetical protein